MPKTLVVGSDHAGLELKRELSGVAAELGYEVVDLGTHTSDSTDYPDYAHQVASAVGRGEGLGLLVCGTGVGMSMAANRHPRGSGRALRRCLQRVDDASAQRRQRALHRCARRRRWLGYRDSQSVLEHELRRRAPRAPREQDRPFE